MHVYRQVSDGGEKTHVAVLSHIFGANRFNCALHMSLRFFKQRNSLSALMGWRRRDLQNNNRRAWLSGAGISNTVLDTHDTRELFDLLHIRSSCLVAQAMRRYENASIVPCAEYHIDTRQVRLAALRNDCLARASSSSCGNHNLGHKNRLAVVAFRASTFTLSMLKVRDSSFMHRPSASLLFSMVKP